MTPKISVIVPFYNVEPYIERCARSLFAQDMNDLEFIFVNDCSSDRSLDILKHVARDYPGLEIKIINLEKNGGVANARNIGLSHARGEYIGFVDSDDCIEPVMFSTLYRSADGADICGCDFIKHFGSSEIIFEQKYSGNKDEDLRRLLNGELFPSLFSEIVRRELYTEHALRFPPGLNVGEDYLMNTRLYILAGSIKGIKKPLYHYYFRSSSLTGAMYCLTREQIYGFIEKARLTEAVLKSYNLSERYKKELLQQKFTGKMHLWITLHDGPAWRKTFPEINSSVLSVKRVDRYVKIECFLVALRLDAVAKILDRFLKFQYKKKESVKEWILNGRAGRFFRRQRQGGGGGDSVFRAPEL